MEATLENATRMEPPQCHSFDLTSYKSNMQDAKVVMTAYVLVSSLYDWIPSMSPTFR